MHYRILPRLVRTTIVGLALAAAMPLSAQLVNQIRPYSSTTVNPCNGETITFSGSIHFHEKTVIGKDGRIHYIANNNFNASGTGQITGRSYNIGGNLHTNSKFPTFPITFRQRTKVISSGSADNFHATFAFHVNGNGVQTNVATEADCQ